MTTLWTAVDIGLLPGGNSGQAFGCSRNGGVIVGQCNVTTDGLEQPFYWTKAGGMVQLELLPGGTTGVAQACSPTAEFIVGQSDATDGFTHAVRWAGGVILDLGVLDGGNTTANAISDDTSTIVGSAGAGPWYFNGGGITALPVPGGSLGGSANGVNLDGSVIAGYYLDGGGTDHAVIWNNKSGPTDLGNLPGGTQSEANAISPTNGVVVGFSLVSGLARAFRWTVGGGMVQIPLPDPGVQAQATGVSYDGSIIVGYDGTDLLAWIWDSVNGTIQLPPLTGGGISFALGISENGLVPVGWGDLGGANHPIYWQPVGPPAPPSPYVPGPGAVRFLLCTQDWTISQPTNIVYGLEHLAGLTVTGLLDGVPLDPTVVNTDGSVNLPFAASFITIGLAFTPQVQSPYLDVGQPTTQGRRKDITAVTVRVNSSAAPQIGSNQPDGGAQIPTQVAPPWTGMLPGVTANPGLQPGTYVGPSGQMTTKLFSGDFRANILPDWNEKGQVAVQQTLPLPLSLTALVPEVLDGDAPEQGYTPKQQQQERQDQNGQKQSRPPGLWMLKG